jgi:(R,R)-butanediol dehydrogenase/meso-butanediol dehydrogenase/diacetyl reductase
VKSVVFVEPGRLDLRELDAPGPGLDEVLVAVAYCGICGSDLHEYAPSERPSYRAVGLLQPVMGHEFSGIVVDAGDAVEDLTRGDAVAVHPGAPCGDCYYCRAGQWNVCARQLGTGYSKPGAYAEYVCVRSSQAMRLPDRSWLRPAALSEPLGVALHALNRGGLGNGEHVLIAGGGPIGLLTLLAATHRDAGNVFLSELSPFRRGLAEKLGANVLDPGDGLAAAVQRETDGIGCDLAVECVGVAAALDDCRAATRRGGRIVVAGAFDGPYSIDLLMFMVQEQSIIGSLGYTSEIQEAADLITSGALDVSPLISTVIGLDDVPDMFAELTADRDKHHKVLVQPHVRLPA